jgi:hypothetical protein
MPTLTLETTTGDRDGVRARIATWLEQHGFAASP